ncbi:MAG: hypothetical protein ACRCT8_17050 [Lacipirellulaceae bacterium]
MFSNDGLLLIFSIVLAAVLAAVLFIPIARGQSDFFTARNVFLVGAFVFNGMSGIRTTYVPHYLDTYKFGDYLMYFAGVCVFYPTLLVTYHFFKAPRRFAGRNLLRWPAVDGPVLVFLAVVLTGAIAFQVVRVPIPVLGELLGQFAYAAPPIGLACAFIAWFRSPSNPFLLTILVIVAGLGLFASINAGISRRGLIAVLANLPITLYWIWLRYKPNRTVIAYLAIAGVITIPVISGFTMVRHMFSHDDRALGVGERGLTLLRELPNAIKQGGSLEGFMGQDSVECAIMTIHLLNDGSRRLEVDPFYAIKYALSNPVPRSLWPEKPESMGIVLPRVSGLAARGINANLGINVVGQCYYDGGVAIHLLYGFLAGSFLRFFDELLVRQPGNPLLTGAFVAMSGHMIGWPRGAIEVMGLQIAMAFASMWFLSVAMRLVFGAGLVYPRTDHITTYPLLRSPQDWAAWMRSYTASAQRALLRRGGGDYADAA